MEIKIKLPGGGYVEFKREPMDQKRFEMICSESQDGNAGAASQPVCAEMAGFLLIHTSTRKSFSGYALD